MKIGSNKLLMSSGEVRSFRSQEARDNFERIAEAVKHGFKPKKKKKENEKGEKKQNFGEEMAE